MASHFQENDNETVMTDEDTDLDEYNDASFDEAFADLIESLRDSENGTNLPRSH